MMTSMGNGASGNFSTNQQFFNLLQKSGEETGDRVWASAGTMISTGNRNTIKAGNTLFGASLLKEFVPPPPVAFMHIDVYGTTISNPLFPSNT